MNAQEAVKLEDRPPAAVKQETIKQHWARLAIYAQRFDPDYKPVVDSPAKRLARLRAW